MAKSVQQTLLPGALLWISCAQTFLVQAIVAGAWSASHPYSLAQNTISDLGATTCGQRYVLFVCSPLHAVMNISFVILGLTMLLGALCLGLMYRTWRERLGLAFIAIGGMGCILVGFSPVSDGSHLHSIGAYLLFMFGNIGVILLGLWLKAVPLFIRILGVLFGILALAALALFASHTYLSLGVGGTERFIAYPQTIWLIIFGGWLLGSLGFAPNKTLK